jgi:hypothetical protein
MIEKHRISGMPPPPMTTNHGNPVAFLAFTAIRRQPNCAISDYMRFSTAGRKVPASP